MSQIEDLGLKRCKNHLSREAVARCPLCTQFFCRECITEHEDRVLCTTCLKNLLLQKSSTKPRIAIPWTALQLIIGFFVIWTCFFYCGQILLTIPSAFHEGTFWQEKH